MNKIVALSGLIAVSAFAGTVSISGSAAEALFHALPASSAETITGKAHVLTIRKTDNTVCRELVLLEVYGTAIESVKYDCDVSN